MTKNIIKRISKKIIENIIFRFKIGIVLFTPIGGYKRVIDDYFKNNYVELQEISARIQNNKFRNRTFVDTLIISCYEYLITYESKVISEVYNNRLKNVVINWMSKQVVWKGTDFKNDFIYERESLDENSWSDIEDVFGDEEVLEEVLEKEYKHQNIISQVMANIETLDPIDFRLYNLVFVEGYNSSRKLSRYTGTPHLACWVMMKDLKEKLRKGL